MASIWVDADACPKGARDVLCKAAIKRKIQVIFVANHSLPLQRSPFIRMMQVETGFDVADNTIAREAEAGDLVITSDIPLASEVLEKNTEVITSRGETLDTGNIRQKLNMRDFMDTMRSNGVETGGGPSAWGEKEKQTFANALDRYLSRHRGN
jgi:uncharacterized protein YaiI (UPF0178 family)